MTNSTASSPLFGKDSANDMPHYGPRLHGTPRHSTPRRNTSPHGHGTAHHIAPLRTATRHTTALTTEAPLTEYARRTGRPTKAPLPGQRASLGLKVTAEIKRRIEAAAEASGRTQSQEAEIRLERSFAIEDERRVVMEMLQKAVKEKLCFSKLGD